MEVVGTQIRVQSLVGKEVVPPQYVQPLDTRPLRIVENINDNDVPSPPVIDLSDSNSAREQLGRACRDSGAFHVINHGVSVELLGEMRRLGGSFFVEYTMDEKLSYACDPNSPAAEGYGSRMLVDSNDTVLDWRDYYDHHTLPLSRRNPSKWPHFSSDYQ